MQAAIAPIATGMVERCGVLGEDAIALHRKKHGADYVRRHAA